MIKENSTENWARLRFLGPYFRKYELLSPSREKSF
jgi:hypothetical protein